MNTESMLEETKSKVIVIGGGAAGLMAALQAARAGAAVILLEKNEKTGKKIYITGKGRCNVTNVAENEAFLRQVPRNPRFLYSSLHAFSATDLRALLEDMGTPTKVEHGGRVFPCTDKASDVTRALMRALAEAGVDIRLNCEVQHVVRAEEDWKVMLTGGEEIQARAVIIATGGASYPVTGSTGDGYRIAEENGLAVTERRGSLVGMTSPERWPMFLQGLSLRNVTLSAREQGKQIYRELGEMLFTHFGFSGPLFIELSAHVQDPKAVQVTLDMKPGLTEEQLDERLLREIQENPRRQLNSMLITLMPSRMAPVFADVCDLPGEIRCSEITRAMRQQLLHGLKELPLPVNGFRPMEEAIVTRGGVEIREISPSTLMSKKCPGLFFAGEVLDVDAHTGGFNLQIAFSTGALAGRSAAKYILQGG